jgi:predicted membrane-bound mannosyltransferase
VAFVAHATSYTTPTPRVNFLAQGAQPGDDLDPMAADVAAAGATGTDPAVLYYGERFYLPNESVADRPTRPSARAPWLGFWLKRLPMAWYVERAGGGTAYARDPAALRARESYPPVVFAGDEDAAVVRETLPGYEARAYDTALYGNRVVVFTDESRLATGNRTAVRGGPGARPSRAHAPGRA